MPGESSTRKFKLPLDECGDYLNSPIENLVELDVLSEARATRGGRGGRGGRAGGCSLARSRSAPVAGDEERRGSCSSARGRRP